MHQNAPLPDKKNQKKISGEGAQPLPRPIPSRGRWYPSPDPTPSAPSALGVPVPFHLRFEHCVFRVAWLV